MQSRVIDIFHQSIEAKMSCGEQLAPKLEAASLLVTGQLLNDAKLLCCGNGSAANLASILAQNLALGYQLERPGFAAMPLATDPGLATGIMQKHGHSELFVEQLRALGNKGDLLVVFSLGDDPRNLVRAIQSAHDKGMYVIAFYAKNEESITASLSDTDIALQLPLDEPHRVCEIHLLNIYILCDLIDYQLFGGTP